MNEIKPGIHSLDHDAYLAAPGISNSMLQIISAKSPLHLKAYIDGAKPKQTDAKRFGTLMHRCIFEPESMEGQFYVKPDGMKFSTKEGIAWKKAHESREIITADQSRWLKAMVESIRRHPTAGRLLKNAMFERSCFVEDGTGTLRKFRADVWPAGGNILPDLKTCESAHPEDFSKSILSYGYHRQAAYYLDCAKLMGRSFDVFMFIAIEKTPPYAVAVYPIDETSVEIGRLEVMRDLAVYRECVKSGRWPGYPSDPTPIGLPDWYLRQMERLGVA